MATGTDLEVERAVDLVLFGTVDGSKELCHVSRCPISVTVGSQGSGSVTGDYCKSFGLASE